MTVLTSVNRSIQAYRLPFSVTILTLPAVENAAPCLSDDGSHHRAAACSVDRRSAADLPKDVLVGRR